MKFKEFKPSSWAIDNKISIYILTFFITIAGLFSYNSLPKESFPEIVVPTIYINTVYLGNSPTNIENLVTKPIEKQLKGLSGMKKLNSTSLQDVSVIMVEFNTNMKVSDVKEKVKDAVDKAAMDLPKDLTRQPNVLEVNFSELPIMYVNLAGKMDLNKLKLYAESLKDKIEGMKEISKVIMVGDLEREIATLLKPLYMKWVHSFTLLSQFPVRLGCEIRCMLHNRIAELWPATLWWVGSLVVRTQY